MTLAVLANSNSNVLIRGKIFRRAYIVLSADSISDLSDNVNDVINKGKAELVGGICSSVHPFTDSLSRETSIAHYHQALIVYVPVD